MQPTRQTALERLEAVVVSLLSELEVYRALLQKTPIEKTKSWSKEWVGPNPGA